MLTPEILCTSHQRIFDPGNEYVLPTGVVLTPFPRLVLERPLWGVHSKQMQQLLFRGKSKQLTASTLIFASKAFPFVHLPHAWSVVPIPGTESTTTTYPDTSWGSSGTVMNMDLPEGLPGTYDHLGCFNDDLNDRVLRRVEFGASAMTTDVRYFRFH